MYVQSSSYKFVKALGQRSATPCYRDGTHIRHRQGEISQSLHKCGGESQGGGCCVVSAHFY